MSNLTYEEAFASPHQVVTVGKLHLPSGKIVACDPYFCANAAPFTRQVAPGNYDVQLYLSNSHEWGQRIALARILFRPGATAVAFEEAFKPDADSSGYFVDSGVGSFMDELTREKFAEVLAKFYRSHPMGNYYTDVLAKEFKRNAANLQNPNDLGKWNLHKLPDSDLKVAMFASGLGDGYYESYWGLSEDGTIVSLITDFKIL